MEEAQDEFEVIAHLTGFIYKVQTLRGGDGEYRVTIDVPNTAKCREAIHHLMDCQTESSLLAFAIAKKKKKPRQT